MDTQNDGFWKRWVPPPLKYGLVWLLDFWGVYFYINIYDIHLFVSLYGTSILSKLTTVDQVLSLPRAVGLLNIIQLHYEDVAKIHRKNKPKKGYQVHPENVHMEPKNAPQKENETHIDPNKPVFWGFQPSIFGGCKVAIFWWGFPLKIEFSTTCGWGCYGMPASIRWSSTKWSMLQPLAPVKKLRNGGVLSSSSKHLGDSHGKWKG